MTGVGWSLEVSSGLGYGGDSLACLGVWGAPVLIEASLILCQREVMPGMGEGEEGLASSLPLMDGQAAGNWSPKALVLIYQHDPDAGKPAL